MLELAPPGRKRWKWSLFALGALMVAAGLWFGGRETAPPSVPPTYAALQTTVALPAAATLTRADLTVVHLTRRQPQILGAADATKVVGKTLRTYLPAGALVRATSVVAPLHVPVPAGPQALVGLSLRPGQLPQGGVVVGDDVEVVILPVAPSSGPPPFPVQVFTDPVWAVSAGSSSTSVTVLVPAAQAAYLSSAAADGLVSLVDLGFPKQ
jgi:hypothetical protein